MSVKQLRCSSSFVRVRLTRRSRAIYLINTDPFYYACNVRQARVDCISKTLVSYSSYKVTLHLIIFSFSVPYDTAGRFVPHTMRGTSRIITYTSSGLKKLQGAPAIPLTLDWLLYAWGSWFPYFHLIILLSGQCYL